MVVVVAMAAVAAVVLVVLLPVAAVHDNDVDADDIDDTINSDYDDEVGCTDSIFQRHYS